MLEDAIQENETFTLIQYTAYKPRVSFVEEQITDLTFIEEILSRGKSWPS